MFYQQNQAGSELSLWGHRPPTPDFLLIHVKRKQKRAPRRGGYTGLTSVLLSMLEVKIQFTASADGCFNVN